MNTEERKLAIDARVDELRPTLVRLAADIHEHPELLFEEHRAVELVTGVLAEHGIDVELGTAGMDTAFRAEHGDPSAGPTVAILAEYDALPKLGHACGHNLIAGAAVGAFLALVEAVPELPGRVILLGTPGEEGGGGKVIMVDEGIFDDVDAAMMFHPSSRNWFVRGGLASTKLTIRFHGKPAHAAASPEKGINALDALIQTFVNINALRQHVRDDVRVHGIVTHGGDAANIVPEFAEGFFIVRADTRQHLEQVTQRVKQCAEGAAVATGARVEFQEGVTYAERNNNVTMAGLFQENVARFGVTPDPLPEKGGIGSSDIGNVSVTVPAIHPYLQIADQDVAGHTQEFAVAACSEPGFNAMLLAAKGLAMTALDIITKPEALEAVRSEFAKSMASERA